MYVKISPDIHWLLTQVQFILSFWETLDDEEAKDFAIAHLEELKQYLTALDGNYHTPASLDLVGNIPRVDAKGGIADSCGSEIL
jgi:hypothetical protein